MQSGHPGRGSPGSMHRLSVKSLLLRFNSYTYAKNWDDLENALNKSLNDSPFDELIHLLHADLPARIRCPSEYVRVLTYNRLEEVPELLAMAPSPFRTRIVTTQEVRPQDGEVCEGQEFLGSDAVRVCAADKIRAAYSCYLKRKDVVLKGIDVAQADRWCSLRQRSKEMEWPKNSQYYILFRVPLGSVLACLDTIARFLSSEKVKVSRRVMKAGGKGLEAAMEDFKKLR